MDNIKKDSNFIEWYEKQFNDLPGLPKLKDLDMIYAVRFYNSLSFKAFKLGKSKSALYKKLCENKINRFIFDLMGLP